MSFGHYGLVFLVLVLEQKTSSWQQSSYKPGIQRVYISYTGNTRGKSTVLGHELANKCQRFLTKNTIHPLKF